MPTDLPARAPTAVTDRLWFGVGFVSLILMGFAAVEVLVLTRADAAGAAAFQFAAVLLRVP